MITQGEVQYAPRVTSMKGIYKPADIGDLLPGLTSIAHHWLDNRYVQLDFDVLIEELFYTNFRYWNTTAALTGLCSTLISETAFLAILL